MSASNTPPASPRDAANCVPCSPFWNDPPSNIFKSMSAIINSNGQRAADLVSDAATNDISEVFQRLNTSPAGLSEEEAAERLEVFGPNEVGQEKKHDWLWRLWVAVRNQIGRAHV